MFNYDGGAFQLYAIVGGSCVSVEVLRQTPNACDSVECFCRYRYMHSVTPPNEILLDDHGDVVIHVLSFHAIFPGLITGCYNCFMMSEDRFNRSSPKVPR